MSAVSRIANVCARLRYLARTYAVGGPVGVYYTVRLARIKRRVQQYGNHIDCEKELHRENLRILNYELTQLVEEQQAVTFAAARYWKAVEREEQPQ
jgi:ribosomal protein L24